MQLGTALTAPPETSLYRLPSILERINLATIFATPQPLEVELGSGDGSFLVDYARLRPELNFIGVDRLLGGIRKLHRKARRRGLAMGRGVRIKAPYSLQNLFPP